MENVVRIEDIPEFMNRVARATVAGVALMREAKGLLAEVPTEIQFSMTVIGEWQSDKLAIVSTDASTGSDNGGSVTISEGTGNVTSNDTGTSTGTSSSNGEVTSEDQNQSDGTQTESGFSTGSENSTSAGTDTNISNGTTKSYTHT